MSRSKVKTRSTSTSTTSKQANEVNGAVTLPNNRHPDYVDGLLADDRLDDRLDDREEMGVEGKGGELPLDVPRPRFPIRFCTAVSGRYRYAPPFRLDPRSRPTPRPIPGPIGRPIIPRRPVEPIIPINTMRMTVRVDVDRFLPQDRISVEVSRIFPRARAHVIAEVTRDRCTGFNRRTIEADVVYRDGDTSLIPGDRITFRARPARRARHGSYELELSGTDTRPRTYPLTYETRFFDPIMLEVDRVTNAGTMVTSYDTTAHPNRPSDLPEETISLGTIYERAGFDVTMSAGRSAIPVSGAGRNGTWSDTEMHNAMITYWSKFQNRPQWSMWVLYAARHDRGRSLGGIMFDDIGAQHRQGTAIFTDSFIQDAPSGDPDPAAWRDRMQFWTAVHEMGHAFNLAHSWQKALGSPIAPGDPWVPLANDNEARSFMNYPFRVAGGEDAFFSDFRFRFTDDELLFMRHAPRRFVQMGNSDWFVNHGFEAPDAMQHTGRWALQLRAHRQASSYQFLEPVSIELKLTNTSDELLPMDEDMLADGRHVNVFVQRQDGPAKRWGPMVTYCEAGHDGVLDPGESLYGAHVISTASNGWLIDEPGFYKVQAAIDVGDEIIVSNILRIYVTPPMSTNEATLAPDYFTEEVGRVLAFQGSPALTGANDVLQEVSERCPDHPAARHAVVARTSPMLRDFKELDVDGEDLSFQTRDAQVEEALNAQQTVLLDDPNAAADTLGHIPYFNQLRTVAEATEKNGLESAAIDLMTVTLDVMKKRDVLPSVIENTERRLKRRLQK